MLLFVEPLDQRLVPVVQNLEAITQRLADLLLHLHVFRELTRCDPAGLWRRERGGVPHLPLDVRHFPELGEAGDRRLDLRFCIRIHARCLPVDIPRGNGAANHQDDQDDAATDGQFLHMSGVRAGV